MLIKMNWWRQHDVYNKSILCRFFKTIFVLEKIKLFINSHRKYCIDNLPQKYILQLLMKNYFKNCKHNFSQCSVVPSCSLKIFGVSWSTYCSAVFVSMPPPMRRNAADLGELRGSGERSLPRSQWAPLRSHLFIICCAGGLCFCLYFNSYWLCLCSRTHSSMLLDRASASLRSTLRSISEAPCSSRKLVTVSIKVISRKDEAQVPFPSPQ